MSQRRRHGTARQLAVVSVVNDGRALAVAVSLSAQFIFRSRARQRCRATKQVQRWPAADCTPSVRPFVRSVVPANANISTPVASPGGVAARRVAEGLSSYRPGRAGTGRGVPAGDGHRAAAAAAAAAAMDPPPPSNIAPSQLCACVRRSLGRRVSRGRLSVRPARVSH